MSNKLLIPGTDAADAMPTSVSTPVRPAFAYTPLDCSRDPNAIRLLSVLPILLDGYIQVEIQQAQPGTVRPESVSRSSEALDGVSIPGYRCLSYTWGQPCKGREILVNGCNFRVRDNLFEFLDTARRLFPTTSLWIDAICIDQNNLDERGHQVEHMGHIYECATEVLIWLGILEGLEYIANYLKRKRSVSKFAVSPRKHLSEVMMHPCWTRAWVSEYLLQKLLRPRKYMRQAHGITISNDDILVLKASLREDQSHDLLAFER
jgi:hypothetical protein